LSIDVLALISHFRPFEDRESEDAWFKTLVPWIGPEAYLNIVYKPAPHAILCDVARKLAFPSVLSDFLGHQNGVKLLSGSLNLCGVVEPGRLLNRESSFTLPPFDIDQENESWPLSRERLLVVGGYRFDGSRACIDRSDGRVHIFRRKQQTPFTSWPTFERWLLGEIVRLQSLFDDEGRRIAPESETGPFPYEEAN
jgi:hypothetical protein